MDRESLQQLAGELIRYWKRQLRLEDWDVTWEVLAYDPDGFAEVRRSAQYHAASIVIRNPSMTPPGSLADSDFETTIVHELLHLRFYGCKHEGTEHDLHECAIERTAQALVHINRGERR